MSHEAKRMISIAVDLMLLAGVLLLVVLLATQGRGSVNAFSEQQGMRPKFAHGIQHTIKQVGYYEMVDIVDLYSSTTPVHIEYDIDDARYRVSFTTAPELGESSDGVVRLRVKQVCNPYLTCGMSCVACIPLHDCELACCAECKIYHSGGPVSPRLCCAPYHYQNCPTGCTSPSVDAAMYNRVSGTLYKNGVRLSPDFGQETLAADMGFVFPHNQRLNILKHIPGSGMIGYEFTTALFEWTLRLNGLAEPHFLCTVEQKYDSTRIESITLWLLPPIV